MSKTLKIEEADAKKYYAEAPAGLKAIFESSFGKNTFFTKITDRIKTFDDVLEVLEIDPDDFEEQCENLEVDEVAYKKIKLIAKVLNEGWEPNWNDSNQAKYYPWPRVNANSSKPSGFSFSDSDFICTYSPSYVGSRLCFKSSELAIYALEQFKEIYIPFLLIIK